MITCRHVIELLIDYLSGELPPEHQDLVDRHLHLCPPCVAFVASYRLTVQLTRQLPHEPLPPALEERLRASLREIEGGPTEGPADDALPGCNTGP